MVTLLSELRPDEVYNLAAQSHVGVSFDQPEFTARSPAWAPCWRLEPSAWWVRTRFYQASSLRALRKCRPFPQKDETPFYPRRPCAKLYAYWITNNYREAYGIFGTSGILFNHESPRAATS